MTFTGKTTEPTADARRPGATDAPDRDLYLRMFRTMALHSAVEDRMVSMYRHGELLGSRYTGHWHATRLTSPGVV
ncbi:hypothetical protein [Mycobacterium helveticum]|jgi:TPP-dependent pyruvate/acetoin dehydrogenase alpha subunit|uniref:hypothetical protein n=1 Tax=Mycobacterium helveticum TaxID=2592811 RepID=UPI001AEF7D59|nr:hypothetical protein [Mycobacterium helveticum]